MSTTTNKGTTKQDTKSNGFTEDERAAMKARAQELKAEARASKNRAEGERDVLAAIAAMKEPDRAMAKRLHAIVQESAPDALAEDLVRDARVCQGRQGRVLLQECGEVQIEVRHVRLRGGGEPRRRRHVADVLRTERADRRGREEDRRAREERGAR